MISKLSGIKEIFHYKFFSKKGKNFFETAKEFTEEILNLENPSLIEFSNLFLVQNVRAHIAPEVQIWTADIPLPVI